MERKKAKESEVFSNKEKKSQYAPWLCKIQGASESFRLRPSDPVFRLKRDSKNLQSNEYAEKLYLGTGKNDKKHFYQWAVAGNCWCK